MIYFEKHRLCSHTAIVSNIFSDYWIQVNMAAYIFMLYNFWWFHIEKQWVSNLLYGVKGTCERDASVWKASAVWTNTESRTTRIIKMFTVVLIEWLWIVVLANKDVLPGAIWTLQPESCWILLICSPPRPITGDKESKLYVVNSLHSQYCRETAWQQYVLNSAATDKCFE